MKNRFRMPGAALCLALLSWTAVAAAEMTEEPLLEKSQLKFDGKSAPDAFRLFSLPFSVMEEGMPAGRSALMAYAEAEGYREICYFEIQRREQPDWDAFLSALAALYPAPPKKIIAPDGDAAAMIREGFDGIVEAFDGSEGAISRFRYDPSTGIQSRYEWTLRTLHITSFPDDETAYRIIGGLLVDQDEEWSRRFGY